MVETPITDMFRRSFHALLLIFSCSLSEAVPDWLPKAPPLPSPAGEVLRVTNVEELIAAIDRLKPGTTILLADGDYRLTRPIVLRDQKDIAICSASGDPASVTLRGQGWQTEARGDDLIHIANCEGVTIANLTFADARSYGIKVEAENGPKNVHIYNCRFRDIGVRAIKGSAGQDPSVRAVNGSVRYCQFENTKIPPADWPFGGDYISAIDMMALENWTFSDNTFRNIKGRNGGARAAIFIWVRSTNIVVERNFILNCDRAIAFGNPGQSTANRPGEKLVYVADGVIRNNLMAGGPDCGIELWHAQGIKVLHNSIWRPYQNWNRGIRVGTGTSADIVNNLVHGQIQMEGGEARTKNNLAEHLDGYFVDPASGDLSLTPRAERALDCAIPHPDVISDFCALLRPATPDLGALEFQPASSQKSPFTFRAFDDKSLAIWDHDRPVLVYNHGPIQSPRFPAAASHTAYIHPIYGLDGETLTDDFPKDHVYHRGLYWAWPHIKVGDHDEVDLWSLRGIRIQFQDWLARETASDHALLAVENAWVAGTQKIMREIVRVKVHPAEADSRAIDLEFAWTPIDQPITLWGAPGKSYGGLTLRFAPRGETQITTPQGRSTQDLLMTKLPWVDFSDAFKAPGQLSGAAIFVHPDHPAFPPEWMTRHYGVLAVGYPGVTPQTFPAHQTFTCRYRIWLHRGHPTAEQIQKAYEHYKKPPR